LEHWAHELAKDKLNLKHRMRNLTRCLGFESLREAEESLNLPADAGGTSAPTSGFSHKLPLSPKDIDACVKRIDELEKEGERARSEAARYAREVELVSAENRSLVRSVEEARSHVSELEKANAERIRRFDERLALRDATIKALKGQLETRSLDSPCVDAFRKLANRIESHV
jgi:predicted RNase H-like nuclease (RuvC/YqgF family)